MTSKNFHFQASTPSAKSWLHSGRHAYRTVQCWSGKADTEHND